MTRERLTNSLLRLGEQVDSSELFPTLVPEASNLIVTNPYAFLLAACLDRGRKAEIIWTIPHDLQIRLGHLDPFIIEKLSTEALEEVLNDLPRKPRYLNDAPRTIRDLTAIVCRQFEGDASRLWRGRRASEVKGILLSIHGVGPGIASMAVLLIEKAFGVRFDDVDHSQMDIKPDTHTVRVLYRLGLNVSGTVEGAIEAARGLRPSFPGEVDAPLWHIGRHWCHANRPDCGSCAIVELCPKIGVGT